MLPARSLDRCLGRKAEADFLSCASARNPMMDLRVPNEVNMQQRPQIMAFLCLSLPRRHSMGVKHIDNLTLRVVLGGVGPKQVLKVFDHLKANLHSHALLRDRLEQRPQHHLAAVALLIAGEVGSNAPDLIPGHERATGADHNVVEVVADRKLLGERWILKLLLKICPGQSHSSSISMT